MLVDLPPGLDYNEWLASHTLALFDHINLVYGTISEFCTMTGCPDMTGPGLRYVIPLGPEVRGSFQEVQQRPFSTILLSERKHPLDPFGDRICQFSSRFLFPDL